VFKTVSRIVITLIVALTFASTAQPAHALSASVVTFSLNCTGGTVSVTNTVAGSYVFTVATNSGFYPQIVSIVVGSTPPQTLTQSFTYPTPLSAGTILYSDVVLLPTSGPNVEVSYFSGSCSGTATSLLFPDSRLNQDPGQTVTAYCQNGGGIYTGGTLSVYTIDPVTSKGVFAFNVTPAEIAAVPAKPAVDTVIKSGSGATLYRLTSGELQLNRPEPSGKMYAFRFADCPVS